MQSQNRLFEDLVKVMNGAAGTIAGMSREAEASMRDRARDWIGGLATSGYWGEALNTPATGYSFVYHIEVALLFVTLVILGPLVRRAGPPTRPDPQAARMGLADLPT